MVKLGMYCLWCQIGQWLQYESMFENFVVGQVDIVDFVGVFFVGKDVDIQGMVGEFFFVMYLVMGVFDVMQLVCQFCYWQVGVQCYYQIKEGVVFEVYCFVFVDWVQVQFVEGGGQIV